MSETSPSDRLAQNLTALTNRTVLFTCSAAHRTPSSWVSAPGLTPVMPAARRIQALGRLSSPVPITVPPSSCEKHRMSGFLQGNHHTYKRTRCQPMWDTPYFCSNSNKQLLVDYALYGRCLPHLDRRSTEKGSIARANLLGSFFQLSMRKPASSLLTSLPHCTVLCILFAI